MNTWHVKRKHAMYTDIMITVLELVFHDLFLK
jgi:hypothetical protein